MPKCLEFRRVLFRSLLGDAESFEQGTVVVTAIPQLNYSIPHNNGPMFERFRIAKKKPRLGQIVGLMVNITLHVGTDSFPFRMETSIERVLPHVDLVDAIRVSLASNLSRSVHESIHTSLFVE